METSRIAVVGSGIAGLGAAWLLRQRHQVTLFEQNDYVGGHTNTRLVREDGRELAVDTGFIVYNEPNYPQLTALFRQLGIASRATDMTFAVSVNHGELEYAGSGLGTLYAQRRNLVSASHQRMVWDILRFNRACKRDLARDGFGRQTVDQYLSAQGLGMAFRDRYLLPMAAAIWSCPTATMGGFPAASLARFFANHGLINLFDRPQWRTLIDGSHSYVKRLVADLGPAVQTGARVTRVARSARGVELTLQDGRHQGFDQVVLACHADQALALLADASAPEQSVLGRFPYQENRALLHTDARLMPRDRRVWSSWNYLADDRDTGPAAAQVSVTYWMNRLQGLDARRDYFVSLNPLLAPHPDRVLAQINYEHPVFDQAAIDAQACLGELQGARQTWFCGSYFGYGFHEDAFASAVAVARGLGVVPQWLAPAEPATTTVPAGTWMPQQG